MSTAIPLTHLIDPPCALESLGLNPVEQRVYLTVMQYPRSTLDHLAAHLRLARSRAHAALKSLHVSGLVVISQGRPCTYRPVAPDTANAPPIAARGGRLTQFAATVAPSNTGDMSSNRPRGRSRSHMMEVLESQHEVLHAISTIQRSAKQECLYLDKPPYVSGPGDIADPGELAALKRGVASRTLIDIKALEIPGVTARVRTCMNAGAEVRIASHLPLKLLIADGDIGLVPMNLHALDGPVLLLRGSSLLDAVRMFSELLWANASPCRFSRSGDLKAFNHAVKLPIEIDQLIPRLAAGRNDKAIAHDLGLSARTFERRMDQFMKDLNARTRFQAGWLAAHRFASGPGAASIAEPASAT
jgi:hypothetical protein